MAYVYRHIRNDRDCPFYIGIGSDEDFSRAKTSIGRNDYWVNIVALTTWEWEIVLDGLSWDDACKKEKEFISIYKRRKDGGTLANLTLGGEGQCGMIPWNFGKETPVETRQKQSLKKIGKTPPNKGKPMPKEQLDNLVKINTGRPSWNKGKKYSEERCKQMSESRIGKPGKNKGAKFSAEICAKLSLLRKGRVPSNKGKKMTEQQRVSNKYGKPRKGVLQFDLSGNFIKEHYSLSDAAKEMGCTKQNIYESCKDESKTAKGFKWKYKQETPEKLNPGEENLFLNRLSSQLGDNLSNSKVAEKYGVAGCGRRYSGINKRTASLSASLNLVQ